MVTEMTIEQRYKRQAVFTAAMFVLCALAFAINEPHVADVALLANAVIWAIYNHLTRQALAAAAHRIDKEVRIKAN